MEGKAAVGGKKGPRGVGGEGLTSVWVPGQCWFRATRIRNASLAMVLFRFIPIGPPLSRLFSTAAEFCSFVIHGCSWDARFPMMCSSSDVSFSLSSSLNLPPAVVNVKRAKKKVLVSEKINTKTSTTLTALYQSNWGGRWDFMSRDRAPKNEAALPHYTAHTAGFSIIPRPSLQARLSPRLLQLGSIFINFSADSFRRIVCFYTGL